MDKLRGKYIYLALDIVVVILICWYLFTSPDINVAGYVLSSLTLLGTLVFLRYILTERTQQALLSAQLIIGMLFLFSGFVKAVDPMGTVFKITDYFTAFGFDFLKPAALVFAFILCCYEFPLGFSILFGLKAKLMTWMLLLIMLFFTVLTFYLALNNPVTDCGCFGDALILSNWETFLKNLVIMVYVIFLFQNRQVIKPWVFKFSPWAGIGLSVLFILFISVYSYQYLPLLDFRPYKVGNDIYRQTIIPEGEQSDVYETVLLYKNTKTAEEKEFDIEHIPTTDEWQWQETINKLVKAGYKPPIHDFRISNNDGNDVTTDFFQQYGYRLLIVQNKLDDSEAKGQEKLNKLINDLLKEEEVIIWALTSSIIEDQVSYIEKNKLPYSFYQADPVMLKTIIRSNPGLLLLKDNLIIKKWPAKRIPSKEELDKDLYQ